MMRAVFVALVLTMAACAPAQEAKENTPVSNNSVPAPTPQDVTVRIGADQNGGRVEVAVNQRFAIELVGVPTAGYLWTPAQIPAFVQRAGEAHGNTTREQSQPDFAGGNHWEVTMFVATQAGEGEILMEQRRPWETTEPPADTFRVTVVAR